MTAPADTEASGDARAPERGQRLVEVPTLLTGVRRDLGPTPDLDRVLGAVVSAMRSLVPVDGGAIALCRDDDLVVVAAEPPPGPGGMPAADAIAEQVAATGRSIRSEGGTTSCLCVALVSLGQVLGTIQLHAAVPDAFDGDLHVVLLEGLATQVVGAVERARRHEQITELEAMKSNFIARVSHELRTPITIVSGFVNTLLTNHERLDDDTRHRMLERVDLATARLSGLIDQMLMLSRLEGGAVTATKEPVELLAVLEEVRRQARTPAAVELVVPAGVSLVTDAQLLVRALGLLVDNALKYAGACRLVADESTVTVLDRGPGIPPERRGHVFDRFTRANRDTTVAGMGVGLPMARTLLAAAGADLVFDEPPDGVGTCVVIRFW